MVRQTDPKKDQERKQDSSNEIPFKAKRKEKKEKYRHQNNWLEEADDDFDLEENLYSEEEEDYDFEEELDSYFKEKEEEDAEDDYDY